MREGPIPMRAHEVRAILAGRQSQFRRIVKPRHPISHIGAKGTADDPSEWGYFFDGPDHNGYMVLGRGFGERENNGRISIPCPYGERGDRLWVREAWSLDPHPGANYRGGPRSPDGAEVMFRATDGWEGPWRPSIHMPRWASRITLEVKGIRVERLQEISEEDAKAEGVDEVDHSIWGRMFCTPDRIAMSSDPRVIFEHLWRHINCAESWDANPWVWVVEFRRVQP